MKKGYESLSMATRDANEEGYTIDFDLKEDGIYSKAEKKEWGVDDFEVETFYRFEGPANPSDNSIVYLINCKDGAKGLLVMAYGSKADEDISEQMVNKLDTNKRGKH